MLVNSHTADTNYSNGAANDNDQIIRKTNLNFQGVTPLETWYLVSNNMETEHDEVNAQNKVTDQMAMLRTAGELAQTKNITNDSTINNLASHVETKKHCSFRALKGLKK